jgi:hypothetical protein
MKKTTTAMAILTVLAFSFVGCGSSDMAKVTINLGLLAQTKVYTPSIFDRIVSLISFSNTLNATPPGSVEDIVLSIELGGSEVYYNIFLPGSSEWNDNSATVEIASGGPYKFIVYGRGGDSNENGVPDRMYGGIGRLDSVSGGAEITLPIEIQPVPRESWDYSVSINTNSLELFFITQSTPTATVQGFRVFKKTGTYDEGTGNWDYSGYEFFATIAAAAPAGSVSLSDGSMQFYNCSPVDGDHLSVYKITPYNNFGEGDDREYEPYYCP